MSTTVWFPGLPAPIEALIRNATIVEWASTTRSGTPISTPLLVFPDAQTRTLDVTTGVAYPVKAERARHRPTVGLALGNDGPDRPLVVVSAFATVRDGDLQANTDRYAELFAPLLDPISGGLPWSACREAVWYWARIFIHNTVSAVRWWPHGPHRPAHCWIAPPVAVPPSDPAPLQRLTPPPDWPRAQWRDRAEEVVAGASKPWLTLHDHLGFPLPFPIENATTTSDGFLLDIPDGHPWPATEGPASLVWSGRATFLGHLDATTRRGRVRMLVDRLLADLPMVRDGRQTFLPDPAVRTRLLQRLETELARRGQPQPAVPAVAPS